MKKLFSLVCLLSVSIFSFAQDDDEGKNPPPRYTMFSVEAAHGYSDLNAKHAFQAKFYLWADQTSNFGFEGHVYFPRSGDNKLDYQFDLNYRKILVDFHPVFFDVLIGPGIRYGLDRLGEKTERAWVFDGINIGFGVGYRYRKFSYYVMPRITHLDSRLQITSGVKYHFNSESSYFFKNRYKLKKRSVN
jgi:hypothetical protein